MIVPPFMNIFICFEQVIPCGVVWRTLESELINEDCFVLNLAHEILYLRQHADMVGLK